MTKQIRLAVQFPGVDNATVPGDALVGDHHTAFGELAQVAQTAERGRFDFLLLADEQREHGVAGRADTFTMLTALAGMTERIGLAGTINPTFHEPYELARQLATLDHLSGGRAAWNVATSWDAHAGENFRRGWYLPQEQRRERTRAFVRTVEGLLESWRGDDILADKASGVFLRRPRPGAFVHRDGHFDIAGQFNVPCSPQGRPVIMQAGDSQEFREFAASRADAIFSHDRTVSSGRAFYADVKSRMAKYGRRRDELLILAAATFVIADTDAEADAIARDVVTEITERPTFIGSGATVAAAIDEFVRSDASDGFLLLPHSTAGLDRFVDEVVPLLQQRGAFRTHYDGATLREHLGLAAADGRAVPAAS